jgi:hypothetical protein
MTDIETIKNNVWDAMGSDRKPFDGQHFSLFTRGFERFSDQVACLTALRIGNALEAHLADSSNLSDLGDLVRPVFRTIRGKADTLVLDILTAFDADGEPRFMLQVSRATVPCRPDRRDLDAQVTRTRDSLKVRVLETRKFSSGLQGYQDTLLSADISIYEEYVLGSGVLPDGDFHRLAAFSSALALALPHKADQLSGKTAEREIEPLNANFKNLLDADGGLPGPISASVVDEYNAFTAFEISKWAAPTLRELASAQNERDFVWGEKYLNYNDLDDSCFAIPTGVTGRSALFHDNISLINDYRSYIAWVDTSDDGTPSELSVRMIDSAENTYDLIERFIAGEEIDRTMAVSLATPKVQFAKNYRDTDILSTLAFHLKVDHEMFVGGQMASRDDCHVRAFAPETEALDEEDEADIARP